MSNDFRLALRLLTKTPLFALVCVLSLGFGIGAASTIVHWMDHLLWRPLAGVEAQERVVGIVNRNAAGEWMNSSWLDYRDYRERAQTLNGVIAHRWQLVFAGPPGGVERAYAEWVSGNYFDVLGVRPMLGRTFAIDEQGEREAPVVVLGERYWRRRFGGDASVVGRTIEVNRVALRVVGIVPESFYGAVPGLGFDLWLPLNMHGTIGGWRMERERGSRALSLLARLAPGKSVGEAHAEIRVINEALRQAYPKTNTGLRAEVVPVGEHPDGAQRILRGPLEVLAGVGLVILVLVCANVGHLLLARAQGRRQEFAVRRALGASGWHLGAQVVAESALLAGLGAGLGLLLATWMSAALEWVGSAEVLPLRFETSFDLRLVGVALLAGTLATLLASIAPAWLSRTADVRESVRGGTAARGLVRWRGGLASTEIALATVSLMAAFVCWRSFNTARDYHPGFDPRGIVLSGLDPMDRSRPREEARRTLERVRRTFAEMPGVQHAVIAQHVPLGLDLGSWEPIEVPGHTPRRGEAMNVWRNVVSPGYFELMRIPMVAGRDFREEETGDVAIVNETFARRYYPGRGAVGQEFSLDGGRTRPRIIGVVKDSKYQTIGEAPRPFFFLALSQRAQAHSGYALMVRGPGVTVEVVQRALKQVNGGYGVIGPLTFVSFLGNAYLAQRMAAAVMTVLGTVAVLLAALGIYGVMAFAVAARRREIGIRMAVGASPADAVGLIGREGGRLAAIGVGAGLAIWLAAAPLVKPLLFGVEPRDLLSLAGASALVALVLAGAMAGPAWRAARVDPGAALRDTP